MGGGEGAVAGIVTLGSTRVQSFLAAKDGDGDTANITNEIQLSSVQAETAGHVVNGTDGSASYYSIGAEASGDSYQNSAGLEVQTFDGVTSTEITGSIQIEADASNVYGILTLRNYSTGAYVQAGIDSDTTVAYELDGDALSVGSQARYRGATTGTPTMTGASTLTAGDVFPDITVSATGIWVVDADGNPQFIEAGGAGGGGTISGNVVAVAANGVSCTWARYQCTGTSDDVIINEAITYVGDGGTVLLVGGTFIPSPDATIGPVSGQVQLIGMSALINFGPSNYF